MCVCMDAAEELYQGCSSALCCQDAAAWTECGVPLSDQLSLCTCTSFAHTNAKYTHVNRDKYVHPRAHAQCTILLVHALHRHTRTPTQPSLSLGKAGMGAREGAEELREAGRGGGGKEERGTRGNKETEQRRGEERDDVETERDKQPTRGVQHYRVHTSNKN